MKKLHETTGHPQHRGDGVPVVFSLLAVDVRGSKREVERAEGDVKPGRVYASEETR